MAFLDKKTRIIDFRLTPTGRDLLAQNRLEISHYAFSDDLIDYRGALSQSIAQSASIDDVVYKNFVPVEADNPDDLRSFLYTCPEQRQVLLPFVSNQSGSIELTRLFTSHEYSDFFLSLANLSDSDDIVLLTERDNTDAKDRENQYRAEQSLDNLYAQDVGTTVFVVKK